MQKTKLIVDIRDQLSPDWMEQNHDHIRTTLPVIGTSQFKSAGTHSADR